MNSLRTMTIEEHDRPSPLPKPARVERWQKWREDADEYVVAEVNDTSWPTAYFTSGPCCCTSEMMASATWTFLGYAKPDKVEVGQRWKHHGGATFVVADVSSNGAQWFITRDDGLTGDWWRTIEELRRDFEYLGMAESGVSPKDLSKAADPKDEIRRANEEAAKRLIANPPEWAYPKAWMCAILWFCERAERIKHGLGMFEHGGAAWMYLGMFHRLCLEGKTVEEATRLTGSHSTPLVYELVGAYAHGMERPFPLMGRPGVKGGISTCDLGGDYE